MVQTWSDAHPQDNQLRPRSMTTQNRMAAGNPTIASCGDVMGGKCSSQERAQVTTPRVCTLNARGVHIWAVAEHGSLRAQDLGQATHVPLLAPLLLNCVAISKLLKLWL